MSFQKVSECLHTKAKIWILNINKENSKAIFLCEYKHPQGKQREQRKTNKKIIENISLSWKNPKDFSLVLGILSRITESSLCMSFWN